MTNMIYKIDNVKMPLISFLKELARGTLLTQWSYTIM
jgi:hypothetical protein